MSAQGLSKHDEESGPGCDVKKRSAGDATAADQVDEDDPRMVEKLTSAAHEKDPDAGSD